mmetsp:Transcript_15238/g.57543  ORF Transcript_15238/g.57543 Transcript_15238/m.57543 type:complete len:215 (-) Transcript_15238:51-695(-)
MSLYADTRTATGWPLTRPLITWGPSHGPNSWPLPSSVTVAVVLAPAAPPALDVVLSHTDSTLMRGMSPSGDTNVTNQVKPPVAVGPWRATLTLATLSRPSRMDSSEPPADGSPLKTLPPSSPAAAAMAFHATCMVRRSTAGAAVPVTGAVTDRTKAPPVMVEPSRVDVSTRCTSRTGLLGQRTTRLPAEANSWFCDHSMRYWRTLAPPSKRGAT